MKKKQLTRVEIKHAILTDERFRNLFPEFKKEMEDVIQNPSCACNVPVYDKLFDYKDRLSKYFTGREIKPPKEAAIELNQNHWDVINCKATELEDMLKKLHKLGRVQLAVARYEEEVTVIVNSRGVTI